MEIKMKYVEFTNEDKIKFFDELSARFYNANFGTLSKSEFELMMFRFYFEKMISKNTFEDKTIDYSNCSDYKISKDLGITQQRVKNLKIKSHLAHPIKEFDWKKALAKLTENARYDNITNRITLNIPDPNLLLEIQNFIEENGAYVEKQLNGKVLQLRAEYYIDLIVALEPEEKRKEITKSLKKLFKDKGKEDNVFDNKKIGSSILNAAVNITDIVANLKSVISPDNTIGKGLVDLIMSNS